MSTRAFLQSTVAALAPILLVLAGVGPARGEQIPCDYMTGSGKINLTTGGAKGSFGLAGGVKRGAFWGNLNYRDGELQLTVDSMSVTKYSGPAPNTRVIEGMARTNLYGDRFYRVTATDNGSGSSDTFRIELDNGYLKQGALSSGNIRLQKGNRDSTPPAGYTCGTTSDPPPPDTTPPTAAISSPSPGSTVSGTITVSGSASDNVGVVGVQFQLDGSPLGSEDTTAPYSTTWDTTSSGNGSHTLTAVARDAAGNTGTSSPVSVTVSNGAFGPAALPDVLPPTVTITSPTTGSTVSGTVDVSASASDNVGVVGVQFKLDASPLGPEDTTAPYSIAWNTTSVANGSHTLTAVARDAAGNTGTSSPVTVTVSNGGGGGDLFVALVNGQVQWRNPDGSLRQILYTGSDGQASSLAFDAARNLYVPHWYSQIAGAPGNTVMRLDANGNLLGSFGSGYNCDPSSVAFDAAGNTYVGQADCTGDILKFDAGGKLVATFDVPTTLRGTDHIYLARDGCTMFYASRDKNIYRYNVCTTTPLPIFNLLPLPGSNAYHLVILPDGGVLVADSEMIVRLDAAGNQVQTYNVPGQTGYLYGGVDFVGDGTFWASNGFNGNIYRFDIQTGAVLASFNTLSGDLTAAGVAVRR